MNHILKACLVFVFFLFLGKLLHAQQQPIDSTQRSLMKNSLQISDTIITQVLKFRESYFIATVKIRSDSSMNAVQMRNALRVQRKETNNGIKFLMGAAKFEEYLKMIRNRMKIRNAAGNVLASGDD